MSDNDTLGDNREFNVSALSDVTIDFVTVSKTAADDTDTIKYTNVRGAVKAYALRTDKTIQIVSMTGVVFTDPITVLINKSHTEHFTNGIVTKMVVRILTTNTNIKLRVLQR